MTSEKRTEQVVAVIKGFTPEYELKYKKDSLLMRVIGVFVGLFNHSFMTNFWTTVGHTTYRPSEAQANDAEYRVIAHEGRHSQQARKYTTPIFSFLYMFPFSLVPLFGLLMLWHWWFVFPMAVCLAPVPAYFRMKFELDAYTVSMAALHWDGYTITPAYVEYLTNNFMNGNYYWMWPFRKDITKQFILAQMAIESGAVLNDTYFKDLHDAMKKEG